MMNLGIQKINIESKVSTLTKSVLFFLIFSRSFSLELTLEEVLKKVNKDSREVKIQELIVEERKLEVKKSFKNFLPTVELESTREFVDEDLGADLTSGGQIETESLNVNMPIFTGFRNTNNYKKSILSKEISEQDEKLVKYDTEERAILQYFEVLNNRTQAEISQKTIDNLEEQKKRLTQLFENNQMIPKSELLRVEADIVAEKAAKERRMQTQRSAEEALYLLMGMDLKSDYTFADYALADTALESYDVERDVEVALNKGSMAKREELLLKDSELDVKLARAGLLPEVSGVYEYRISDDDDDFADQQVTLTANWEIFSWGSTLNDIKQKKVIKEQAELNYANRMDEIALELRDQNRNLAALHKEIQSEKLRFELLRENLEIDSLRYLNGLIEGVDYLDSVSDLSEAAATYYSLQREFILAQREYENLLK